MLLVLLRGILGGSWGLLRHLGRLLGPLGNLLGASWGGLAGLEVEKWPWLQREHDFVSSQGGSWAEIWPWLEREQDFEGSQKSTRGFGPAAVVANPGGPGPPKSFS